MVPRPALVDAGFNLNPARRLAETDQGPRSGTRAADGVPGSGPVFRWWVRAIQGSRAAKTTPAQRLIHELIDDGKFSVHFQPVVNLSTAELIAYEALARPGLPGYSSVEQMMQAAVGVGRIGELGRLLRGLAVEGCPEHPLFVNVDANEFDEGWLVDPTDPVFFHDHPVHVELTESAPIDYFEQCRGILAELRQKGIGLIIDDLGAGYSNLRYIADLEPNLVKLDRSLIAHIDSDGPEFRLLRAIVTLCSEMGAKVVAEGIETVEQLLAVREAGAQYGQGFLLGRPTTPPAAPTWPAEVPRVKPMSLRIVSDLPTNRENRGAR